MVFRVVIINMDMDASLVSPVSAGLIMSFDVPMEAK